MPKVTKADLERLCEMIRKATGNQTYHIGYTGQRPRLYRNGEREVSARMSKSELYTWMWAYYDGIGEGYRAGEEDTKARFAELGITLDES